MNDPAVIEFPGRRAVPRIATPRIAVIGAGLAGLVCAERLMGQGWEVTVFDKGRGPGGRLATRRADELRFDHGAQYFTARDPRFRDRVDGWVHDGVAALWNGRIVRLMEDGTVEESPGERFVGTPGMNAPARTLAAVVQPRSGVRVATVTSDGRKWRLEDERGTDLGSYDMVVAAVPGPQAVPLLAEAPDLASRAADAVMAGCWTVMAHFERRLDIGYDGAFVTASPLSWIARNSSKPCRPEGESWVLHGSPEWSQRHIEDEPDAVIEALTAAFREAAGVDFGNSAGDSGTIRAEHLAAHRWRFSLPVHALDEDYLFDPYRRLGACGDWCNSARVEGAFLSGLELAERMISAAQG
jgi:renalase